MNKMMPVPIFLLLLISCTDSENYAQSNNISINIQADSLKKVYQKAVEANEAEKIKYQQQFLNIFPSTFSRFDSLYGAKDVGDSTIYMPLFHCCNGHILLFNELNVLEKTDYYNKYINIAIDGKWDADNISDFQTGLSKKMEKDTQLMITLLRKKTDREVRSFWHFFYDGPHPDDKQIKKQFDAVYEKLIASDSSMAKLMKDEYEKLLKEKDGHGH